MTLWSLSHLRPFNGFIVTLKMKQRASHYLTLPNSPALLRAWFTVPTSPTYLPSANMVPFSPFTVLG